MKILEIAKRTNSFQITASIYEFWISKKLWP